MHMHKRQKTNKDEKYINNIQRIKLLSFFDKNSNVIQAICELLSVLLIGICTLILSLKSNQISEEQFNFSTQPYFTISEIGNGGLENFEICNQGGYIQNASLELTNMLKIDIYNEDDYMQSIYVPFGTNIKELYDLKNNSFSINNPKYVMEASEMENRIISNYEDTEYNFKVSAFQWIELIYLDYNHDYVEEKYLICTKTDESGYQGCYLVPLKDELLQMINDNMPEEYKEKDIYFPEGALSAVGTGSGGRGSTRTVTDDAQQEVNQIIDVIDQIVN